MFSLVGARTFDKWTCKSLEI
uniref:Uncharacterized protein n=1 Tax=Anguilla anguilla TaxID=7936 RepID=A0A0E9XM06_ANGAN